MQALVRPTGVELRLPRAFPVNRGEDLFVFREASFLELGKDELAVHGNFEDAAISRMQVEAGHIELVLIQQRFRQPDGLGLIPSRGTVEDIEIHRVPLGFPQPLAMLSNLFRSKQHARGCQG